MEIYILMRFGGYLFQTLSNFSKNFNFSFDIFLSNGLK